jgi:hypothetical protein
MAMLYGRVYKGEIAFLLASFAVLLEETAR